MVTAPFQDLLTRTKEAAGKRAADTRVRYGKLVLRAARGEHLDPENVLQSLTSWGSDAADFAEDVEYAAGRIELKEVADQFPARTAAKEAAFAAAQAVEAEYAAEVRKLEEHFGARIRDARAAHEAAAKSEAEAGQALRRLIETCRDADTLARLDQNRKEQSSVRGKIHQERVTARKWSDEAHTAEQTERRERAAARILAPGPFGSPTEPVLPNTEGRRRRQETITLAPALIAEAEQKAAALEARLAELAAEEAALSDRLLDPWPAAGAAGK